MPGRNSDRALFVYKAMLEAKLTQSDFVLFQELIYGLTGIHLLESKHALVQSRLQRRLSKLNLPDYGAYYNYVTKQDEAEVQELINAITTNKTDFYREPHHFDFLGGPFATEMTSRAKHLACNGVRIWSAGCSTGQEAFTIAMVLSEALLSKAPWDVRILASDIDTRVLSDAERAIYPAAALADVPVDLVSRHFLRGTGGNVAQYKARPHLREMIRFRPINLLEQPWPIRVDVRFDAIFCRNTIIYFDKATQKKLVRNFADRLRPRGYLFLGHSESMMGLSDLFDTVGPTIHRLRSSSGGIND